MGLGLGAVTDITETGLAPGANDDGNTVMASFWPPTAQWLGAPQMYHFLPGVDRFITSLPLVNGTVPAGAAHCLNPVPFTLSTLCTPS